MESLLLCRWPWVLALWPVCSPAASLLILGLGRGAPSPHPSLLSAGTRHGSSAVVLTPQVLVGSFGPFLFEKARMCERENSVVFYIGIPNCGAVWGSQNQPGAVQQVLLSDGRLLIAAFSFHSGCSCETPQPSRLLRGNAEGCDWGFWCVSVGFCLGLLFEEAAVSPPWTAARPLPNTGLLRPLPGLCCSEPGAVSPPSRAPELAGRVSALFSRSGRGSCGGWGWAPGLPSRCCLSCPAQPCGAGASSGLGRAPHGSTHEPSPRDVPDTDRLGGRFLVTWNCPFLLDLVSG